ncbi:DUF2625 family protein [Streptomyces sp. NBC_01296]|uniref:DUF2625 family protein n=1 Tax=Streptomyces sp. NBC_01296 TaxID=2903816 RepID=UPI002E154D29|nr:DUF2625 family protein [Streptomyces sp. NBC_01296]
MRGIDELVNVDDPAWPELEGILKASSVPVQVLPGDINEGRRCLLQMQVIGRSVLGALALHTGGFLVDNGWLRVFGAPQRFAHAQTAPMHAHPVQPFGRTLRLYRQPPYGRLPLVSGGGDGHTAGQAGVRPGRGSRRASGPRCDRHPHEGTGRLPCREWQKGRRDTPGPVQCS